MRTCRWIKWLSLILLGLGLGSVQAVTGPPGPGGGSSTNAMIGDWTFSDTNWLAFRGYAPLAFTNVANVPGGNGNALRVDSTNTAFLQYRVVEGDGTTNLMVDHGSLIFWFRPSWSSTNQGGIGPGDWSRFLEVGAYTTNASY